jgi:DNA polymerase I-like protein with 3'-5' exonuclease and polymerase domains
VTLPDDLLAALRVHRAAVWGHLGGDERDQPSLDLLARLGVEVVVPQTEAEAVALLDQMELDADLIHGGDLIGLDIETAAHPGEETRPGVTLTLKGTVAKTGQKAVAGSAALDPYRSSIRLVQLYGGGSRCAVLDTRLVPLGVLTPFLGRCTAVIHNASFELKFLTHTGIVVPKFEDTMQAVGILLGVGRRALDDIAGTYLGLDLPKELQTSDWGAARLSPGQLAYAALDAIIAWQCWQRMLPELHAKQRHPAYALQRDVTPVVARMELRGIGFDAVEHRIHHDRWALALADARHAFTEQMGTAPPTKPAEKQAVLRKLLSSEALAAWPRTAKTGQLSVRAADLKRAIVAHPEVKPIVEIDAAAKLLSSFGVALVDKVCMATGRLHAHFNIGAAKSGRFSSSGPNIQQIPNGRKAPGFRACFVAAPGHVLIKGDYHAMELRLAAEVADDPVMRSDFATGIDPHQMLASMVHGIDYADVPKTMRDQVKPISFGTIYGSGGLGLAQSAWLNYGISITADEAAAMRDKFLGRYQVFANWMRVHATQCQFGHEIQIGKFGRVIEEAWASSSRGTPQPSPFFEDGDDPDLYDPADPDDEEFGWMDRAASALRYTLCCNAPIQGAGADIVMMAMLAVERALAAADMPSAGLVLCVHDELVIEAPEDRADEAAKLLEQCMVQAFAEVFPQAPTRGLVEIKTARTWGPPATPAETPTAATPAEADTQEPPQDDLP